MMRLTKMPACLVAAGWLGLSAAGGAAAQEAISIDVDALHAGGCFGRSACTLDGATLSTSGGSLSKKLHNGVTGFGVNGGPSGGEIDIGEKLRVEFDQARPVVALKILFLYNGPEFGDRAEKARVVADGVSYTLSTRNDKDDAEADWSGPGTVTKCGATTASGTGCFTVTDPFPGAVRKLEFTAIPGGKPFPPHGHGGSSDSDYAIGFIDAAAANVVELQDCAGPSGCPIATVGGNVAFSLNSMQVQNPGGSTEAVVIPVRLPDCRYIPQACIGLLPPAGDSAASDDAARALLIGLGVIRPLNPSGPDKLHPAAQLLNVTPLLPPEVTALFDASGKPPNGLPPMYLASSWRGQAINGHWFDGFFFKTDSGVVFSDVFEGLIDVSELTGHELGCFADPANLLAWDVITTVSELAKSVGARHIDALTNVGCENPTKVSGTRLSLYAINLEVAPDTYGPTIQSSAPKITPNNDAVFARLAQSLWADLGETKAVYACKRTDPAPPGAAAPLSKAMCKSLAPLWTKARNVIKRCVNTTFKPAKPNQAKVCALAKQRVEAFEAALPATATGPDAFNRVGELRARVDVFQHVWDERFLRSLKPAGFCREKGACPP